MMIKEKSGLPFRFQYMQVKYNTLKEKIDMLLGLIRDIALEDSLSELDILYYEHLNVLVNSAFWEMWETSMSEKSDFSEKKYRQCWEHMFAEMPRVKELVSRWDEDYIKHITNMIKRIKSNWHEICAKIGTSEIKIEKIDGGDSDVHEGKCVHIIEFDNGKKIVYKPRALKLDCQWYQYLQKIAEVSGIGSFFVPWVLDKEDYGFEEFVCAKPIENKEEFARYFYRCGFLLGIAYVLQGSDLHNENLIAHGEYPVLIDLETGVRACANTVISDVGKDATDLYKNDSVIRTNLLPFITMGRTIRPGGDAFTTQRPNGCNLPFNQEGFQTGEAYMPEIINGFTLAYRTIREVGIRDEFDNCEVRFLVRNTSYYAHMQNWIYERNSICDGQIFEARINKLREVYEEIQEDKQAAKQIFYAEKNALEKGYIPRLVVNMSDFWNGNSKITLQEILRAKVNFMNEDDLRRQCIRIKASLNRGIDEDENFKEIKRFCYSQNEDKLEIIELLKRRVHFWKCQLKEDELEGLVVCSENQKYYVTNLPWNVIEGVPGVLPAFIIWRYICSRLNGMGAFLSEVDEVIEVIIYRMYKQVKRTSLNGYKTGIPEGIDGLFRMTQLAKQYIENSYIEELYKSFKEELDKRAFTERYAWHEDNLKEGMEGFLFPSFYYGEGGWLYFLLCKSFSNLISVFYE